MNDTPISKLLSRLDRVRECGPGRWMAVSPAFPDQRTGSLSIRELDDGRILIHDFAGAEVGDVLSLIGLSFADLYPPRIEGHSLKPSRQRHQHASREALRLIALESRLVVIAAENLAAGVVLDDDDRDRLLLASTRIGAAGQVTA